jgi:hypothetical protein
VAKWARQGDFCDMKKSILMSATILALAIPAWAGDVQIRLTHDKPGLDSDQLEIVHQDQNTPVKQMLFVDHKTLVNQDEIKSATLAATSDGTPRLRLELTPDGEHSVRHDRGRNVAVLADGRALLTGELRREKDGTIDLIGDFSQSEAQRAVDQINQASTAR